MIAVCLAGCDCSSTGAVDGITMVDAGLDAAVDAAPDAAPDAGPDAGLDASAPDATLDAEVDEALEAGLDAALDAGPDASPDAGSDAGPEPLTCTSCHGSGDEPAPPVDTLGRRDTSLPTVGAHREHLGAGSLYRRRECTDCHIVPDQIDEEGHVDDPPAEIVWAEVASAEEVVPGWDGQYCTVYCHGVTLAGGENTTPDWTGGGGEAYCGSCHGVPPPAPHPDVGQVTCGGCHPFDRFTPLDPQRHGDGNLDVDVSCTSCHGSDLGPAPPVDTHGNDSTADRGVGAHASHLGESDWHAQVVCTDCHLVPGDVGDATHIDPDGVAELTFGDLATTDRAEPEWDGTSCSGVYCHGGTLSGGTQDSPTWTQVDGTQAACGTCHGLPPTSGHPRRDGCARCHGGVVDEDRHIVAPELHINGEVDLGGDLPCGSCHDLPPATGSHQTHAALAAPEYGGLGTAADLESPDGYAFGCGYCHPLDQGHHMNGGLAEVELYDPAAPEGSLKSSSPDAAYEEGPDVLTDTFGVDYTLGTCSEVYCHGGMQTSAPDVPEPGVDFEPDGYPLDYPPYEVDRRRVPTAPVWGGDLGCGGCHGYPPRGEFPGVEAGAGESHAFLDPDGYEDLHIWNHGRDPVPCRTCHLATVEEIATFARDEMGLTTFDEVEIAGYDRHVDGTIDVEFDATELFDIYPTPLDLGDARWDAETRTCTNVACHFEQTSVTFGTPYRYDNYWECNVCHRM
ncbi:MAG: CxxxxCH/CxxCH domain-containing protein [Deltaproteobacteria bacterium]|nr:CxxxxCH/CxxCH domain-containing protein [Deltaproteobacteria bacterium]